MNYSKTYTYDEIQEAFEDTLKTFWSDDAHITIDILKRKLGMENDE